MATVIKIKSHIEGALRFVDTYGTVANTTDEVYLGVGRPTAWADEANPDTPLDTKDDETNFWASIIGAKKIDKTKIVPVVTRINWVSGDTYVIFDKASTTAFNSSFYVLNSESRVYQCVLAPVGAVTNEPLLAAEDLNGLVDNTATDGYQWQYLYQIPQVNVDNLLNDTWMPVNYGDTLDANDTIDDENSVYTLGAKYVLIQVVLLDTDTDVGADGTSYRQTAVISNPLDSAGALLTSTTAAAAGMTTDSGSMLHLENKFSIIRATGQSEIAQQVLSF